MQITVVGQGYVGLPLAMAAAEAGYEVNGLDVDHETIDCLRKGESAIEDISNETIQKHLNSGNYKPTYLESVITESKIILVCVPTPLHENLEPNLDVLIEAVKTVGKNLKSGSLVVIESTIAPGTCREIIDPLLSEESGLSLEDYYLAYSPERIDPVNKEWGIENTPKLIAGRNNIALDHTDEFYSKFVKTIVRCSSFEIAETSKLLENSFRLVNISFINEVAKFCQRIGIDVSEVIAGAATKPYGFMAFYPSVGVGGHCIPVDPIYLSKAAQKIGSPLTLIQSAYEINRQMPAYFVSLAEIKLGSVNKKRILILGVAYKPNVSDVRETPVKNLITELRMLGALVSWHDDLVNEWNGEKSVALSTDYDLAILATPHDYLDLTKLGNVPILNTRGSI
jgi:UDP-N-acetyl-D-glucosamine dehydrogenase